MDLRYNVCIIQPPGYVHSLAFLELAELITISLSELGYDSRLQFNALEAAETNILIGCHLLEGGFIPHIPPSTIVLNTEQVADDLSHWHKNIYECSKRFPMWDYSSRNIEKMKALGAPEAKLLKLGFQKELARIRKAPIADIDVLFYGSVNERRLQILNELEARGLKVTSVFGVYGAERDALIARSKVVLNLHMYKSEIFEVVRVFYLLTNGIPVVGEVGANTFIEPRFAEGVAAALYENLAEECERLVNDTTARESLAERALQAIKHSPQRVFTAAIL
jgi:hypothetical protein